jgi:hypothetical protein
MPIRSRTIQELISPHEDEDYDDFAFSGLHYLAAGLFLASGAEAALGERRGDYRPPDALRWAPLATSPIAAAAHAARAIAPNRATRIATQIMNGVAVAVGAAGLASSIASAVEDDRSFFGLRHKPFMERIPSLAPLAFGVAGVLGAILDRQEQQEAQLHDDLERRARIVERFTPRRKAKLDRIVVHV